MRCAHVSGCSQRMSHEDASQTMVPVQVPAALQPTLQPLPLQAMGPVHAPAPRQSIAHELARVQSIAAVHAPAPVQVTAQGIPTGHAIGPVQVPAATHSTVQVPAGSQVPTPASTQSAGHTSAASLVCASRASTPASSGPRASSDASAPLGRASFTTGFAASASAGVVALSSVTDVPIRDSPHAAATDGIKSSASRGRVSRRMALRWQARPTPSMNALQSSMHTFTLRGVSLHSWPNAPCASGEHRGPRRWSFSASSVVAPPSRASAGPRGRPSAAREIRRGRRRDPDGPRGRAGGTRA